MSPRCGMEEKELRSGEGHRYMEIGAPTIRSEQLAISSFQPKAA